MTDATYVLCRWQERLWPAKVLAKTETPARNKRKKDSFLDLQILSLEEKVRVRSAEVEALRRSRIEDIASFLASQQEAPAAPLEELTYRRSLRVALDVLSQRSGSSRGAPAGEDSRAPWARAGQPHEADPSPRLQEDAPGAPGPESREHAQQSPRGQDAGCRVDLETGLGRRGTPGAPPGPASSAASRGGRGLRAHGSRALAKRGRSAAQRPGSGQKARSPSEAAAGSRAAPASPSRVREDDPCAKADGHDPGLPSGSLTVLPAPERSACPGTGGRPAKRPRLHGSQRPGARHRPPRPGEQGALGDGLPGPGAPACAARGPRLGGGEGPEEGCPSSEESVELNSVSSVLEDDEEDEEPPRILLFHEPSSFEVGMLVWLKYQKYPFWPAVVKSVRRRDKKASVLFIEGDMDPKGRGITVSLRRLKHFDCKEKQALLNTAKEDFDQAIGWCVSLITDYRVRLGCGSFAGSFLEYYAADISYPVRKSIQQDVLGTKFPPLSKGEPEAPVGGSPPGPRPPFRKVLPDRSRAARDRANQKLVEYIVKAKGAESHLRAILRSRRPSRWLHSFLSASQHVTCVETYLEDEGQLERVVQYLQGVCQEAGSEALARANGDRVRFILDVLLPEAVICAISAVDAVDYKTAEEKYIKGPSPSYREKEIFDNQLLEERSRRRR